MDTSQRSGQRGRARQRRTPWRLAVAGVALVAAAGATGVVVLANGSAPADGVPPVGGSPVATAGPREATVTLPTGDRVAVRLDADGQARSAHPVGDTGQSYRTESYAGEMYVVPVSAQPRLASGDWSLAQFDVTALASGKPGVEPGAGSAHPDYPMHTVTINVTDASGKPADEAELTVVNVDDTGKYVGQPYAINGQARISVPDGHYAVLADNYYESGRGPDAAVRLDFGAFTVDGGDVTTTMAMADAKNRVSVSTPRPAKVRSLAVTWFRGSSDRNGEESEYLFSPGQSVYMSSSPDGPGVQHSYVQETATSPKSAAAPYLYDVEFPSDGPVGADQSYTVTRDDLATVDSSYYSDQPDRTGDSAWYGFLPWDVDSLRLALPLKAPLHRIEYVTANPDLPYEEEVDSYVDSNDDQYGWEYSGDRVFEPGERVTAEWLRGPIVPGIPSYTGTGSNFCGACRADDTLSIALTQVTDSTPNHGGDLDAGSSHFQLYQGDTKLVDRKNVTGADVTVPAGSETYKAVYDQTRKESWTDQSTRTHTVWTFDSAHSGSTTVPANWYCTRDEVHKHCSALPLLLPHYKLAQGLDAAEAPGSTGSLDLTLGHEPGVAASAVDSAAVSVSFDGGTTWRDTSVQSLGGNQFRARWANPDSGMVSFKVTATDTAGNTLSQTTVDALTIGGTR